MCLWGLCFLQMFLKHQKCNSTNSHVLRLSFISRILQHSDWNFKDAFSLIETNIKDKLNEIKWAVVTLLIDVLYSVKASIVLFTELRRISDLLHPTSDRNLGALMNSSQWFCHRVHRHWLSFISPSLGSQRILHQGIIVQIEPFKWSTSLKVRYSPFKTMFHSSSKTLHWCFTSKCLVSEVRGKRTVRWMYSNS